ncbi:hypothetical protein VP01_5598g1, partial [Puccinia sorghi]
IPTYISLKEKSKKNRGNNSSKDDAADKTASHLKKDCYLVIIKWLKIKQNYNACFGNGKAPAVGCPAKDQPNPLSGEGTIQHLQRQLQEIPHQLIHFQSTINEKLESMCSHYHAINKLMGDKAFVNPLYKVDAQADNKTATYSTSEPAGNEIRSSDMECNNDSICVSTSFS